MLRTNLATRPFYNDRAVRGGIAVAVVLVAALSAFNALQVMSLRSRNAELGARAERAEAQTTALRQQARSVTQALNAGNVTVVQQAAREANMLIERRVFSWTDLFNRFERTLPADVRILAVEPQVDRDGRLLLAVTVIARRVEDLNTFMDQLELTGALRDVIARQDATLEDGTLRAVLQGYYVPRAAATAATPPPASDSSRPADNASPSAPDAATPPAGAPRGGAR